MRIDSTETNNLFSDEFRMFVSRHADESADRLRLRYHGSSEAWIPLAIAHIECMKKCGRKFGTLQPGVMTSPLSVEQASSEPVARFHGRLAAELMPQGGTLLDMTCGMGIDLRAISEATGARSTAFELNRDVALAACHNFADNQQVEILNADSVEWLRARSADSEPFDLVFIDPARRDANGGRVFNLHDCAPDVVELLPMLAANTRKAMVKLSPMLDVTQTLRDLPCITSLHVVEERGECRELLAILDFTCGASTREAQVISVDICTSPSTHSSFCFTQAEGEELTAPCAEPSVGDYLFEPGPAAMKAQPFSILCSRHALRKLHRNTHLFTAPAPVEGLPGKWHRIEGIEEFTSASAKQMSRRGIQGDVAVRNFPLTAPELQKRLKIKSGGNLRLFGVTACSAAGNDRRLILFTER